MSASGVVPAVYEIQCDHPGCPHRYIDHGFYVDARYARFAAAEDGWQVWPLSGTGSRSAPDYCPEHASA